MYVYILCGHAHRLWPHAFDGHVVHAVHTFKIANVIASIRVRYVLGWYGIRTYYYMRIFSSTTQQQQKLSKSD